MDKTTGRDLIRRVSARNNVAPDELACHIDAFFEELTGVLARGGEVAIRRFGTFKPMDIPGNTRPDPSSGVKKEFPATRTARWRPSKLVRDRLRNVTRSESQRTR